MNHDQRLNYICFVFSRGSRVEYWLYHCTLMLYSFYKVIFWINLSSEVTGCFNVVNPMFGMMWCDDWLHDTTLFESLVAVRKRLVAFVLIVSSLRCVCCHIWMYFLHLPCVKSKQMKKITTMLTKIRTTRLRRMQKSFSFSAHIILHLSV